MVISKNVIGAALAFLQHGDEVILVDQRAGKADALVKPHQMRRGVNMDSLPGGLEASPHGRDGRALAIGARDMNDGRQFFLRVAERGEQPLDPAERQIDFFRVELHQAAQHPIARDFLMSGHHHSGRGRSAAGASTGAVGAVRWGSRSNDSRFASVACNSPRGTTRSTIPCS